MSNAPVKAVAWMMTVMVLTLAVFFSIFMHNLNRVSPYEDSVNSVLEYHGGFTQAALSALGQGDGPTPSLDTHAHNNGSSAVPVDERYHHVHFTVSPAKYDASAKAKNNQTGAWVATTANDANEGHAKGFGKPLHYIVNLTVPTIAPFGQSWTSFHSTDYTAHVVGHTISKAGIDGNSNSNNNYSYHNA